MLDVIEIIELSMIAGLAAGWLGEHQRTRRMMIDPAYGIYTRVAAEARPPKSGSIIFWDIDDMRSLNQQWTYEGTDQKIKTVLKQVRAGRNCHLVARWYSGDEFIYSCPSKDAASAADRIQALFRSQGISITIGIAPIVDQDWQSAVRVASLLVQEAKCKGQHGGVFHPPVYAHC
ncbi:hypothetical protein C7271_05410 [filamentous cyanobacterium CCP5]|nr:hypothetical protein C7271_05410 [filamentous cyanobacterium CCP5]